MPVLAVIIMTSLYSQVDTAIVIKEEVKIINKKDSASISIIDEEIISVDENTDTARIKIGDKEVISVEEKADTTRVSIGDKEVISVEENNDTTKIRIGNKIITIIDGPDSDDTKINIRKVGEEDEDYEYHEKGKGSKKFKGDWAGIQVGLNNYVNSDFSTSLDNTMNFMDLNTGRSWTYSLNFLEHGFGFRSGNAGMVTGLGLEWCNYVFDRDLSILKDSVGNIVPYPLNTLGNIHKNKLQTIYLNIPLLLEFHIPAGNKEIHISGGPVGALKLGSHTKIIYKEGGDRNKIKEKDDFNLSPLRLGLTARAGYKGLNIFLTYYLTSLFEANKGPELYPFSAGLTLINF